MRKQSNPAQSPTISLRLPPDQRERLDRAARRLRRSRSFLMQEALARHLDAIEQEQAAAPARAYATLLAMAGKGVRGEGLSAEDIDAHIEWLRSGR